MYFLYKLHIIRWSRLVSFISGLRGAASGSGWLDGNSDTWQSAAIRLVRLKGAEGAKEGKGVVRWGGAGQMIASEEWVTFFSRDNQFYLFHQVNTSDSVVCQFCVEVLLLLYKASLKVSSFKQSKKNIKNCNP